MVANKKGLDPSSNFLEKAPGFIYKRKVERRLGGISSKSKAERV